MTHTFIVTVRTDDTHANAPNAKDISDEILTHLEYDMDIFGIHSVRVEAQPAGYARTEWPDYEPDYAPLSPDGRYKS